jgi:hypothetical protein
VECVSSRVAMNDGHMVPAPVARARPLHLGSASESAVPHRKPRLCRLSL